MRSGTRLPLLAGVRGFGVAEKISIYLLGSQKCDCLFGRCSVCWAFLSCHKSENGLVEPGIDPG